MRKVNNTVNWVSTQINKNKYFEQNSKGIASEIEDRRKERRKTNPEKSREGKRERERERDRVPSKGMGAHSAKSRV